MVEKMNLEGLDFEDLDIKDVESEVKRTSQDGGDFLDGFVNMPKGEGFLLLRFLPRKRGRKLYCATRTHRLNDKSFHCPRELVETPQGPRWQGKCVVCDYLSKLWKSSMKLSGKQQEELQNKYREMKAIERYYYLVIARNHKNRKTGELEKNAGPLVFPCGKTVHSMIMRAIAGDVSAGIKSLGNITDPTGKTGRDFRLVKKISKSGNREFPNYDLSRFEDPSPLGSEEEVRRWLTDLRDLNELRVVKDENALQQELDKHLGLIRDDETSFDEVSMPETPVSNSVVNPSEDEDDTDESEPDPDFMKSIDELGLN